MKQYTAKIGAMLEELSGIDRSCLDPDQKVDHELMMSLCRLELVKWEGLKMHKKDPALYLPFEALNYLLPVFGAKMSTDINDLSHPGVKHLSGLNRLVALLSRVRSIPSLLHTGQENLTQPVTVFTERAIKLCLSFRHFLSHEIPVLTKKLASFVGNGVPSKLPPVSAIIKEITHSANVASECVIRFEEFLLHTLLPKATDSTLVGRDLYDAILLHEHFITDSDQLLELGEKHFAQVKEELVALSKEIDATKTWQEITRDVIRVYHPTASSLLDSYISEIHRAKDHMVRADLVPRLPHNENVIGFYTPEFLTPFSPFGDFLNPACFSGMDGSDDGSGHTGYLMLHSVSALSLAPDDEDRLLQSHDYTWISVIATHECYPGHHVQALLAQQHPRVLRKYYESTLFYEGWGLYCEQLAYENWISLTRRAIV